MGHHENREPIPVEKLEGEACSGQSLVKVYVSATCTTSENEDESLLNIGEIHQKSEELGSHTAPYCGSTKESGEPHSEQC